MAIFFSPLAAIIPTYATAGALFYIACLMLASLKEVNWDNLNDAVPVTIACLTMPLTFSIAHGIALGFISYVAVRIFSGEFRQLNMSLLAIAGVFILKFAFFS